MVRGAPSDESLLDRAHRLCGECGLDAERVDWLIDSVKHSTLSHEENLRLFLHTFADPADAELCSPCAEAVLDVPAAATTQETPGQESQDETQTKRE